MAAEPKRRHSKARKRTRRASIKLGVPSLVSCKNCNKLTPPHTVCKECGFYKGKASRSKQDVKVIKA